MGLYILIILLPREKCLLAYSCDPAEKWGWLH